MTAERKNGGNTSRMGAGKVLIFNEGSGRYRTCWEAHMYLPDRNCNAWGAGTTPKEAYGSLIDVLVRHDIPLPYKGSLQ